MSATLTVRPSRNAAKTCGCTYELRVICGVTTPEPDVAQLVVLAISLLGLGAMRSIDKQQGNAT